MIVERNKAPNIHESTKIIPNEKFVGEEFYYMDKRKAPKFQTFDEEFSHYFDSRKELLKNLFDD